MPTLQRLIDESRPVAIVTLDFPSAMAAEFLVQSGFDAIAIDFEHGRPEWSTVENIVRVGELTDTPVIARIADAPHLVSHCLDLGIANFQLAHVADARQVDDVLDHVRFAPRGSRGIGRSRANRFGHFPGGYGQFRKEAEDVTLMVHVESAHSQASLPDLIAIPEVHVVVVGAQDLAASLGHLGDSDHPEVRDATADIVTAVRRSGKAVAMSASSPADVGLAVARGASVCLASQARLMSSAARQLVGELQ